MLLVNPKKTYCTVCKKWILDIAFENHMTLHEFELNNGRTGKDE